MNTNTYPGQSLRERFNPLYTLRTALLATTLQYYLLFQDSLSYITNYNYLDGPFQNIVKFIKIFTELNFDKGPYAYVQIEN